MSDGDEEPTDAPDEAGSDGAEDLPVADDEAAGPDAPQDEPSLEDALAEADGAIEGDEVDAAALTAAADALETAVERAGTEAEIDEVEAAVDDLEAAIESADLPEPDGDDEAEDPRAALEDRVAALRDAVEDARGPYAEDVVATVEEAGSTIGGTRWTETGEAQVAEAVGTFLRSVGSTLDADLADDGGSVDDHAAALEDVTTAIDEADLDPDEDAEPIGALVEAAETLAADLEAAEAWEDLTTREQLDAEGFYDVLDHHKDYPPEWSALKEHEKRGNAEMVLLALEKLGSEFMEEHCLDALRRMGPAAALDPMLERAERRDKPAIEILGKIGDAAAVESIVEYVETDSDPQLQKTTLKALGEIGSEDATQAVANKLVTENEGVRSHAARALGMIGDPRAVEPLADALAGDASDTVRASAAWALVQIGTGTALEVASEYAEDPSYLVSSEAERATEALGAATA